MSRLSYEWRKSTICAGCQVSYHRLLRYGEPETGLAWLFTFSCPIIMLTLQTADTEMMTTLQSDNSTMCGATFPALHRSPSLASIGHTVVQIYLNTLLYHDDFSLSSVLQKNIFVSADESIVHFQNTGGT